MNNSICHKCFWILTPQVEQGICSKPEAPVLCPRNDDYCITFKDAPPHMTLTQALAHAEKHFRIVITRPTLIAWCKNKGIGRQVGGLGSSKFHGRWRVFDLLKFREILNGED